jgi:DNA-binding response OmpR family regulator
VDTYRLTRGERGISLPPIPLKILEVLMRASPRVVRREEIQTAVWGDDPPDSDALKAHIHVLRSAVDRESDRPLVHTLRGLGYQVADTDGSPS